MNRDYLSAYLNDHLAGSTAALELLADLQAAYDGTAISNFIADLHADVTSDRQELDRIMRQLGIAESHSRRVTTWLTEKVGKLKLRISDPAGGDLRLLEAFDALSTGIEGKRDLWTALAAAADEAVPALRLADYDHLVQRAAEQLRRLDGVRAQIAPRAFARPA